MYVSSLVKGNQQVVLCQGRISRLGVPGCYRYLDSLQFLCSHLSKKICCQRNPYRVYYDFDNIAAITIQPYFGALSDNTYTKFGHRLPYLMIGIPIAAVFYALIPFAQTL